MLKSGLFKLMYIAIVIIRMIYNYYFNIFVEYNTFIKYFPFIYFIFIYIFFLYKYITANKDGIYYLFTCMSPTSENLNLNMYCSIIEIIA